MAALTADRNTPLRDGEFYEYPIAASKKLFAGSLIVLDASGDVEPGTTATGKIAVGRCEKFADNSSGSAADINAQIRAGTFQWANSSGDAVTKADIGSTVYVEDDNTVAKTATGKSAAGIMVDIDAGGVWVETKPPVSLVSGLTAANNLSDVANAATARGNLSAAKDGSNSDITELTGLTTDLTIAQGGTGQSTAVLARGALGADQVHLSLRATDLLSASAEVYRIVSPWAGTIDEIHTILQGAALATGDATLTCSINGTDITGGVVTITQSGSAEGDIDKATPSALNVLAAEDAIEVTIGGSNTDANAIAEVIFQISQDV